jgi:hypothetical protein
MKTMQDIFELALVIEKLKSIVETSWRFETTSDRLKTDISVWSESTPFSTDIQIRYMEMNNKIKQVILDTVAELEVERDRQMLSYMTMNKEDKKEEETEE